MARLIVFEYFDLHAGSIDWPIAADWFEDRYPDPVQPAALRIALFLPDHIKMAIQHHDERASGSACGAGTGNGRGHAAGPAASGGTYAWANSCGTGDGAGHIGLAGYVYGGGTGDGSSEGADDSDIPPGAF
jgi:hypothetical protein